MNFAARRPTQLTKPLFASFLQAGFECSTHKLADGTRLDLISSTKHDKFAAADYDRVMALGMRTIREGLRWHLIEASPGVLDFGSALSMMRTAQQFGMEVIWDLFHFGWPDYLDIFSEKWIESFANFAFQFCQILRKETSGTIFVAPINEISFISWAGGDAAYLNPFCTGRGSELKRQLVRAAVRASKIIRAELPLARLVAPEPVIHIIGDPSVPGDVESAEVYRRSMFEAWDMLSGRLHPELGGEESLLDIIGINYYDRNQWWNFGKTIRLGDAQYRPFHQILLEVYQRYQRPMFVSETGAEDDKRPGWFAYICSEVQKASSAGIPMHGLCLYPILNHPGWVDNRHCRNGLWDYADPNGERTIYLPLAEELGKCTTKVNHIYENQS